MARDGESVADEIVGAAVGMLPVVGPFLGPVAERLSGSLRREHARNVSVALRAAERTSGLSREDLGEAIDQDPDLVPLVTRVLYAAGMTGSDEVLKLMGAALGDAINDRIRIDESEMVLAALTNLRAHHLRVLELLAESPPPPPITDTQGGIGRWWSRLIQERLDFSEEVVILCVAGLTSGGMLRTVATYGGDAYELTDLGRALLEVLETLRAD